MVGRAHMKKAPIPENEAQRLAALRAVGLLDTPPEPAFDDFAKLAAHIAGTPIALVTLIDEHRQWFKARLGIEGTETPRDAAFCAHAIVSPKLFIVPNAVEDERFKDNPFVTGETHVRFYAGAPFTDNNGHALGALCVIDRLPRELTQEQRDALGRLASLLSAHVDLRRKAMELATTHEESLRKTERLRVNTELLDLASDQILVLDPEARILYWNRGAERAYGFTAEEAQGQVLHELLQTRFPKTRAAIGEELMRDDAWEGEVLHTAKDGRKLVVESRLVLQRDEHGKPRALLAINHDVTQRREVQRMKDEFVSIVSHELRTPLTSIRGALGLLEGGVVGDLGDEASELVRIARTNADRLIRLVNDILDLEKMEAGKLELQRRDTDARSLVRGVVEGVASLAKEADVTIASEIAADARLVVDEDRIAQLLTNLVSNAIKFSPSGSRILVRGVRRGPRTVRLSVTDQGPGIPEAQLGKLFGKFQQLDASDRRARGGTGLGLAISKAIVEQHGGTIGVETKAGQGATFYADLPAVGVSSQRSIGQGPRRLVLLLDPRGTLSKTLGPLLSEEGCVVARAADLTEAERWLDNAQPAAILVDVELAEGATLELVDRLVSRYEPSAAPTVVLTGRAPDGGRPVVPLPVEWVADPLDEQSMRHALRWGRRDHAQPRVLLIEDDPGFRAVIAARLRHLGTECIEAGDADAALTLVRDAAPDLIVLDVGLPGRDGFDIVDELRRVRARSTPLIVYTARDLGHDDRVALSLGLTRWLTKARTTEEEFVQSVRELLNGLLPQ